MAEIHVEKKKSVWPWIIAALVALLAIWALMELMGRDDAEVAAVEPTGTTVAEAPPAIAPSERVDMADGTTADASGALAALPVATILAGPASYVGQEISGTARVTDVPTDRGFWVEQNGQRMFAVIAQGPNMEKAINVNAGQEIQIDGAAVHDANSMAQVGGTFDEQTKQIISDQQAFLVVDPNDITIVSR